MIHTWKHLCFKHGALSLGHAFLLGIIQYAVIVLICYNVDLDIYIYKMWHTGTTAMQWTIFCSRTTFHVFKKTQHGLKCALKATRQWGAFSLLIDVMTVELSRQYCVVILLTGPTLKNVCLNYIRVLINL